MRVTVGKILHALYVAAVYAVLVLFIPVIVVACVGASGFESFMAMLHLPITYEAFKIFAYACLGTSIIGYYIHEKFFAY